MTRLDEVALLVGVVIAAVLVQGALVAITLAACATVVFVTAGKPQFTVAVSKAETVNLISRIRASAVLIASAALGTGLSLLGQWIYTNPLLGQ